MTETAPSRGRAATWRKASAAALDALSSAMGPHAAVDRDRFAAALDEAVRVTVNAGWRHVPPASRVVASWHAAAGDAPQPSDLASEAVILRAVGIGFDLSRDARRGHVPDVAAHLRGLADGSLRSGRGGTFMSGLRRGGLPELHVNRVAWDLDGRGTAYGTRTVLRVVDAGVAPVAARLSTPDGDGLDVRREGGAWLRPLLAPGSWRPVSLHRAEEIGGTGAAWRDDPWRPRWPRGVPCLSVGDQARRGRGAPSAPVPTAALTLVGEVVHLPCGAPVLTLSPTADDRPTWRLTWAVGGLDGCASQSTWASRAPPPGLPVPPTVSLDRLWDAKGVLRDWLDGAVGRDAVMAGDVEGLVQVASEYVEAPFRP